jgi:hypothetical protein
VFAGVRLTRTVRWAALGAAIPIGILLGPAGVAQAADQDVITSSGPLTNIFVNDDLACQLQDAGDTSSAFFSGTDPGHCGTWLSMDAVTVGVGTTPELFGPSVGPSITGADNTGNQTVGGAGTSASPYTITTTVAESIGATGATPADGQVQEVDSYVVGQDYYTTTITVTNTGTLQDNDGPITGYLYHGGDCYLNSEDTGYGGHDPSTGEVDCTLTPNNSPAERVLGMIPGSTAGYTYVEGQYGTVWSDIDGSQLPDTVDTDTDEDNGEAVAWAISIPVDGSPVTETLQTLLTPYSFPSSSSTAGTCAANGQYPVTVDAVSGPSEVDYTLDGGAQQSASVSLASGSTTSGTATITIPAGLHELTYWGVDNESQQEPTHHTVQVGVEPSGPAVAFSANPDYSTFDLGQAVTFSVKVAGVGLTGNPAVDDQPLATSKPGTFTITRSATDVCGTNTGHFTYTVLPAPALGKTVNVAPVSGTVLIKLPSHKGHNASAALSKGVGFVPLTEARQIPVGSIIDASRGKVGLLTATATRNKTQTGDFTGLFQLLQSRKQKGLTDLNIMDTTNHRACVAAGKAQAASTHKKLSSKVLGLLTGTAKGKFVTHGQFSSATIRGTQFGVRNQCNGTLTRVERGLVTVDVFRTRKKITLRAGHSYLAKAPAVR